MNDGEGNKVDNPRLALIEAVCISWFTIEYLLRFAGNKVEKKSFDRVGGEPTGLMNFDKEKRGEGEVGTRT